jgi:hypothetical protein
MGAQWVGILAIPLVLQGLAMVVDEFWFHHKRGLRAWEKWGHPFDTLTVIAAFAYLWNRDFGTKEAVIFAVLSFFSCLFVTKDEWVHAKECPATEQWLHAVLFVLHPLVFLSGGFGWWLWSRGELALFPVMLGFQIGVLSVFGVYQVAYWQWVRKKLDCSKPQAL